MSARDQTHALLATRPDGWLMTELQAALGIAHAAAMKRVSLLAKRGLAASVRVPGHQTPHRYFASRRLADAWLQQQPAHAPQTPGRSRADIRAARAAARAARQAGPTIRERVLQGVQQAGRAGVVLSLLRDELGLGKMQMVNAVAQLAADDLLHCQWHKNRRLAWAAGVAPSESEVRALKRVADADVLRTAARSGRARWGHSTAVQPEYPLRTATPAPVTIGPTRLQGEADTSRAVRITADPIPYTARHQFLQLAPDPRWPSFLTIPLGGTLSQPMKEVA